MLNSLNSQKLQRTSVGINCLLVATALTPKTVSDSGKSLQSLFSPTCSLPVKKNQEDYKPTLSTAAPLYQHSRNVHNHRFMSAHTDLTL